MTKKKKIHWVLPEGKMSIPEGEMTKKKKRSLGPPGMGND